VRTLGRGAESPLSSTSAPSSYTGVERLALVSHPSLPPFLFCVSGQLQQHNADAQRGYLDKKGSVSLSFWSRAAVSCPQKCSKCS